MESEIIMQDEDLTVLLPKKAITKGHLVIVPNKDYIILEQADDETISKMFQVANKLSSVLFDNLKCQGTNILIQNGVPAGQINNKFSINVVPRFENDNLNFEWTPKKSTDEELAETIQKFQNTKKIEEEKNMLQEKKEKVEKKEENVIQDDKDNYLTRSLERLP